MCKPTRLPCHASYMSAFLTLLYHSSYYYTVLLFVKHPSQNFKPDNLINSDYAPSNTSF
jgi:hypothetical protein